MRLQHAYLDEGVFACLEITTMMPILDLDIDVARASIRVNRHGGDSDQWAGDNTGMKIMLCDQKHVSKSIHNSIFACWQGPPMPIKGNRWSRCGAAALATENCEATGAPEVLFDRCQFT